MHINDLAKQIEFVRDQKKYGAPASQPERKMLLAISEICEAHSTMRDGHPLEKIWMSGGFVDGYGCAYPATHPEGFLIECADGIMRLLDLMQDVHQRLGGPDPESVILHKLEFNKTRPEKNGRQF